MIITKYRKQVIDRAEELKKLSDKIRECYWKKKFAWSMQPVTVPGNEDNKAVQSYALFRTYYTRAIVSIDFISRDYFSVDVEDRVSITSLESLSYYSLEDDCSNRYASAHSSYSAKTDKVEFIIDIRKYALQTKVPFIHCAWEEYGNKYVKNIAEAYQKMYSPIKGTKYAKGIITPDEFSKIEIAYTVR